MKLLTATLGSFASIIAFMKLLSLLNAGNTLLNLLGITGMFLLAALIIKTKVFTTIKFKNKTK